MATKKLLGRHNKAVTPSQIIIVTRQTTARQDRISHCQSESVGDETTPRKAGQGSNRDSSDGEEYSDEPSEDSDLVQPRRRRVPPRRNAISSSASASSTLRSATTSPIPPQPESSFNSDELLQHPHHEYPKSIGPREYRGCVFCRIRKDKCDRDVPACGDYRRNQTRCYYSGPTTAITYDFCRSQDYVCKGIHECH